DTSIRLVATLFLADLLMRLYRSGVEYVKYSRNYLLEDRVWTILRRSFSYDHKHTYLALFFVFAGLSRISITGDFRAVIPTVAYLVQIPLYWFFYDLSRSTLNYSQWIRDPHGLDYAAGMASNYVHGYLKLSLPEREDDGLKHRMAVYEDKHSVTFGVDRLVILMPDEMFVNGKLESKLLEKAEPLETRHINRAGVYRPFKHAVYRLKEKINGKTYYFAMEGATPLLSFYDSMQSNLSATWQMREMQREIWLKFYKHLKELIKTCPETRNEVELIAYNAHDNQGNLIDVGELLIALVLNRTKAIDELSD
ncbi:hypothetical protein KR009_011090, partial [Drosophila setifemur]